MNLQEVGTGSTVAGQLKTALIDYRTGVFSADSFRTVGFLVLSFGLLLLFLKGKLNEKIVSYGLILLVMIDLISHNLTYLSNEKDPNTLAYKHWEKKDGTENLPVSNDGDAAIFELESRQNPQIKEIFNNIY